MKRSLLKRLFKRRDDSGFYLASEEAYENLCTANYTSLDKNPEIMAGCRRIAELIGSLTIHLMENTRKGDVRLTNALSRTIDIEPCPNMTRKTWMEAIVMNLLLHGGGNSIVLPHTWKGYIQSLEPISASRVSFKNDGYREYQVYIDGVPRDPGNLLHFVHNPDKFFPWMGRGVTVYLKDIANNLKQATATEKAFMESKWKPSIIVKVDAMVDEFSSPEGREKTLEDYVKTTEAGQPWILPMDQFDVKEVRPLTLADLAINDTVQIEKRTIAAMLGMPAFLLGVGEYSKEAWNSFIQNTVRPIAIGIQQEMTKKLIVNPRWYLKFNVLSLMDWNLETIYKVFGGLSDKGIVTGNEVRDRIGMSPLDGLDELRILENFIPADRLGDQKKLLKEED